MPEHVDNRVSGNNSGKVVQARDISGGVHFHEAADRSRAGDKQRLLAVLRAMTLPIIVGDAPRTGFTVAPGRLVTFGTDVMVVDGPGTHPPCLYGSVEPGDELWALGYPKGDEPSAEVVGLRCLAVLDAAHTHPQPLELRWGEPGVGSTGGPVVNWRTGAVCGLMLATDSGMWLVPAASIPESSAAGRAWLELLDDDQLRAGGQRYPGAVLRAYLADVRQLGEGHPYRPMVRQGPSLTEFYLPQQLHHESDGAHRITVDMLAERHDGAQVLGDPGVGKSSLVRHLAAESAGRWLDENVGAFVPILVSARALAANGSLPRLLADGVTREIATVVDGPALITLFEREPMPGTPWLVLVDGLDEVLNEFDRRLVLDRVLSQRGRTTYRFLVTSRPLGRGGFTRLADQFPTYVVEPFDDDELSRFAAAWFVDAGHDEPDPLVAEFMAEVARSGLGRLARVPLVSMMLCIVFISDRADGLPRSQYAVYERFFAVLARKLETAGTREEFRRRAATYGSEAEDAVARLVTGLPGLLEQIAVARQGVRRGEYPDTRTVLTQAVDRSLPGKPSVVPAETWAELVEEALRASGLLVHRHTDFRFLHQTIEEYLAAKHIAARASRADRRALLAPQTGWPWPHLEIKIFVVALWTARGIDLTPQFTRLLARRHRELNAGFVVELGRRGVPLPTRVRQRACDVLAARIHSDRTMSREWVEAVRWLRDLDAERTADELERLARGGAPESRAVEAVQELTEINRDRGAALATLLINVQTRKPVERFGLAVHLLATDRTAGIEVLTTLARQRGMADMAVEAALRVADEEPSRGHELLAWLADANWSGTVSLAAGRALLNRQPAEGVAILNRIWPRLRGMATEQIALAKEIAKVSIEDAQWRLAELARDTGLEPDLRYSAIVAMSELDTEQGAELMMSLARERGLTPAVRIALAKQVAERDPHQASALLAQLVNGSQLGEQAQWRAIEDMTLLDEDRGVVAMNRFVRNGSMPIADRLAAASKLVMLGRATEILPTLEEIADSTAFHGQHRLDAADIVAGADPARGRTVYKALASDHRLRAMYRVTAVDRIRDNNTAVALNLYLLICANGRDSVPARIEAGGKAGEINKAKGVKALADLIRVAGGSHDVDNIAMAAVLVDRELAIEEWRNLRRYSYATDALRHALRRLR